MGFKRKSREEGHIRKFLVVIDDTPECSRAVAYASKRAEKTGGQLLMLYVVKPTEFQHWLGVESIMRAEAQAEAEAILAKFTDLVRDSANTEPEQIILEGMPQEVIAELVETDEDIVILILAAAVDGDGPGPLVSSFTRSMTTHFPIPLTIVPGDLKDEEIEALC